ncbi:IS110 family transposase [Streptomyces scopuliridis]|uniref:IS110 family transposase n=1 Tax=Streptomyces scopuliridis TaxID=452529 RepID=UPI0036A4466B
MAATAGSDIGKDFHWLAAIDDRGGPLVSRRVDNDPESIEQAIGELLTIQADHDGLTVGVDLMGGIAGLLTAMLLAAGLRCVHMPGLAVNRARRGTREGENKSDPRDAKVIAEQVMLRDDSRAIAVSEEATVDLRLLVSHRTVLAKEITARISFVVVSGEFLRAKRGGPDPSRASFSLGSVLAMWAWCSAIASETWPR